MKTAIVAGATGLIGSHLVKLLAESYAFDAVKALVRKPTGLANSKVSEMVVDYNHPETLTDALSEGDTVFCCLGTTMRKAGSRQAFYKVDYTYVVHLAESAKAKGANEFLVVSSSGAITGSIFYYSRVKGEMENRLKEIGFEKLVILRPSLLLGKRNEHRSGEKLAQWLMPKLDFMYKGPLKRVKPVEAENVAKGMIKASLDGSSGTKIIESEEIKM